MDNNLTSEALNFTLLLFYSMPHIFIDHHQQPNSIMMESSARESTYLPPNIHDTMLMDSTPLDDHSQKGRTSTISMNNFDDDDGGGRGGGGSDIKFDTDNFGDIGNSDDDSGLLSPSSSVWKSSNWPASMSSMSLNIPSSSSYEVTDDQIDPDQASLSSSSSISSISQFQPLIDASYNESYQLTVNNDHHHFDNDSVASGDQNDDDTINSDISFVNNQTFVLANGDDNNGYNSNTTADSNNSIGHDDDLSYSSRHYRWFFLFLLIMVVAGIFGNILVCLAIYLERRLQNATNYFLLSLAIADLLVSILVMPISIVSEIYGSWPFGTVVCNLWVTCDVLCCSSSIYHMCMISVGRYMGIQNPIRAKTSDIHISRRAIVVKIVIVWLTAAVISSPITILGLVDQTNVQPEPEVCSINNKYFIILGAFFAFYLPMLIMINTYIATVRLLKQKAKFCKEYEWTTHSMPSGDRINIDDMEFETQKRFSGYKGANGDRESNNDSKGHQFTNIERRKRKAFNPITTRDNQHFGQDMEQRDCNSKSSSLMVHGHVNSRFKQKQKSRTNARPVILRTPGSGSAQVRTEQKATQVLGLVFFLFILCWAPFFTRNVIEIWLPKVRMPVYLPTIFQQLGFFSSTINPVIYTVFNRNFRRAFRRILLCKTSKYNLARRRNQPLHVSTKRELSTSVLQATLQASCDMGMATPSGYGTSVAAVQRMNSENCDRREILLQNNRKLNDIRPSGNKNIPTDFVVFSTPPNTDECKLNCGSGTQSTGTCMSYQWKFKSENPDYHIDMRITGKSSQV
ncbi:uncharacterized protein LOC141858766 [Brevipalpus obovatus]|uniref:uncharacterized protein LOC141858766 n=1 Tax=Brevipalpus obovatus TaxID=246614 RepID=UPI003D9DB82E